MAIAGSQPYFVKLAGPSARAASIASGDVKGSKSHKNNPNAGGSG